MEFDYDLSDRQDFTTAYYCSPEPDNAQLRELAERYHAECEAYDRTVCTGPIKDGSIMPADYREMALINKNATAVRRRIALVAEDLDFTRDELTRAIGRVGR